MFVGIKEVGYPTGNRVISRVDNLVNYLQDKGLDYIIRNPGGMPGGMPLGKPVGSPSACRDDCSLECGLDYREEQVPYPKSRIK